MKGRSKVTALCSGEIFCEAKLSTEAIYHAVAKEVSKRARSTCPAPQRHLDIGAGRGELVRMIARTANVVSTACDFDPLSFSAPEARCVRVDLDRERLPFPDAQFDLVTCSEVLEHLENFRQALREAYRVMAPSGSIVVTTPNVLNAASRIRYTVCGFAKLFGPLPMRGDDRRSTGSHITPIPYFYLAHAFSEAGFDELSLSIDKVQRTSVACAAVMVPFLILAWPWFLYKERRRWRSITTQNLRHVRLHASWAVLLGRTIVLSARKPGGQPPG